MMMTSKRWDYDDEIKSRRWQWNNVDIKIMMMSWNQVDEVNKRKCRWRNTTTKMMTQSEG